MSRSAPDLHLPATKATLWSLRRVSCVDLRRRAAAFRKSASAERDGSPCPSTTISRSTGLPFEVDTLNLDLTVQEGMSGGTSLDVLRPVQTGCGGAVQRQIAVTSRAIA